MNTLLEAAHEVTQFMRERNWEHCIIGGLAVQRWSEPRATIDADFVLLTEWGREESFVAELLAHFRSRISDAHNFALTRRVLLIAATNGTPIDVALGALPFEIEMVRRAKPVEFAPQRTLHCCTAEDLFVTKAFAGRPRDWLDVEALVTRTPDLDKAYILRHLNDLMELKDDKESLFRAQNLLK